MPKRLYISLLDSGYFHFFFIKSKFRISKIRPTPAIYHSAIHFGSSMSSTNMLSCFEDITRYSESALKDMICCSKLPSKDISRSFIISSFSSEVCSSLCGGFKRYIKSHSKVPNAGNTKFSSYVKDTPLSFSFLNHERFPILDLSVTSPWSTKILNLRLNIKRVNATSLSTGFDNFSL